MRCHPLDVPSLPNLILGCGYLGRRAAQRWLAEGRRVAALTRRNADALAALGIEPLIGDVLEPTTLPQLPRAASVLYAVGLDRAEKHSMREVYVDGLANVLRQLRESDRFLYISSTSVYGQTDGEWVDEDSPTEPIGESGQIVREAERLLCTMRPDAFVLRFGGIYGPDRLMRRQSQLHSGEPLSGVPDRWLNLIHADDGVSAVLAAESRSPPGGTYNIVDDEPVMRREYYAMLAELVGAPAPRFDEEKEDRQASRRVSNAKAKSELSWRPQYPSYREGLSTTLRDLRIE
jgi:nucleoside-diphosphate-sugar epimerase